MTSSSQGFDPYLQWLGIQPHEQPANYYRLLGINQFESDHRVISNAADQRMLFLRTFQIGPNAEISQTLLNEMTAAQLCLLNPKKKARYDQWLRENLEEQKPADEPAVPVAIPVASGAPGPPAGLPSVNVNSPPRRVSPPVPTAAQQQRTRASRRGSGFFASLGWLPVIAVLGTIAVAGIVWAIGTAMMDHQPVAGESDDNSPSQAQSPSAPAAEQDPADSMPENTVTVFQEGNGSVHLTASVATRRGANLKQEFTSSDVVIRNWTSTDDWLEWDFLIVNPGKFSIKVHYQLDDGALGGIYELSIGEQTARQTVEAAAEKSSGNQTDVCQLEIQRKGAHQLQLRAIEITGQQFMSFRSIEMIPIE